VNNRIVAFPSSVGSLKGRTVRSSKVLIVEHPQRKLQRYLWDEAAKQQFLLNEAEADDLEHGAVLWRGSTAFIVERLS
jgi:hypothetical protein